MIRETLNQTELGLRLPISVEDWAQKNFVTPQKIGNRDQSKLVECPSTVERCLSGSQLLKRDSCEKEIDEKFLDVEEVFEKTEGFPSRCIRTTQMDRKRLERSSSQVPREYNSCRFIPSKRKSNYNPLLINLGTNSNCQSAPNKGRTIESAGEIPRLDPSHLGMTHHDQDYPEGEIGYNGICKTAEDEWSDSATQMLIKMYKSELLGIPNASESVSRMLRFTDKQGTSDPMAILNPQGIFSSPSQDSPGFSENLRKIPKSPYKVLDAPLLQDDFYLNLIDWAPSDHLAVGLSNSVYLWSPLSSKVTKVFENPIGNPTSSVKWASSPNLLAIGTHFGQTEIWDSEKLKKLREFEGHTGRVGTISCHGNTIATGSRDKMILIRDARVKEPFVSRLLGHKQEICGLKWSFDGNQLASGGNDNKLFIWSLHSMLPVSRFTSHTAAVKALAWSPHQHGLLASGGGTADKTIRFWNTLQGNQVHFIDTGSQVCNLIFSKNVNELVSTHGYSLNQIAIWNYPSMKKITTLSGHSFRVLYLAMSPDGETIVTGAGDETLRFWDVFPSKNNTTPSSLSKLRPSFGDMR